MKIGVYDSGIGGMTIAQKILEKNPQSDIIYFADSKFFPYNDKSRELIFERSVAIISFLKEMSCSKIVIACNTAASIVLPKITAQFSDLKIFSIIDMLIGSLPKELQSNKLALLGTVHTVSSGVYDQKLQQIYPNLELSKIAAPRLAGLCEDFICDSSIDKSILYEYLEEVKSCNPDYLIIACTHYAIMLDEIKKFFLNSIVLIHTPNLDAFSNYFESNQLGSINIFSNQRSFSVEIASKKLLNSGTVNLVNI